MVLRKYLFPLIILLFILVLLPITYFAVKKQQELRGRAAMTKGPETAETVEGLPKEGKPEYAAGEVLVKLKVQSAKFKVRPERAKAGINVDKTPLDMADLDTTDRETGLLVNFLKEQGVLKLEKVFKGSGDPKEDVAKFKARFPKRASQVKPEAKQIDLSRTYKLSFDKMTDVFQKAEALSQNQKLLEYAEPNYIVKTSQTPQQPESAKRVFVTSNTYTGNLGGLNGADAKCQERANASGLGGNWKAWLSDSTTSAASRLNQSSEPYKLINGTTIANNWSDLTDGALQSPINITELGNDVRGGVWTYTLPNGNMDTGGVSYSCNNWTDGTVNYRGVSGFTTETSSSWTKAGPSSCNALLSLYCFDQTSSSTPTSTPTPTPRPNEPNDPYYPQMWNLSKIKMEDAWNVTKGSKDVTIAVVDTGIDYTHQELGETIVPERSFEQITTDSLSLFFPTSNTRVSQTIVINNNRLAYYSDDKIYIYSFDTTTTDVINLPSTAPDPMVIRLALKDNILVYAADYNHSNYYSTAQLYLYNLTTREHRQISDFINSWVYPFEIGEGKVVWTVGAHVYIYDIQTGVRSIQTNPNTYPFQYISYLKASGNRVAYSLHSEESPCYQAIVIHNIDTDQRQRFYPPNMGAVMDFEDNKVLYRACYGNGGYSQFYIFDITTGQWQELSYSLGNGATGGETKAAAFITWVFSMIDEGFFGDGVVFISEDSSGNGIVAFDQNSHKYVKISLVKAAYNFTAEGKRICFVSSDSRIYCHMYDANYDYPPSPESYFNNRVVSGYNFVENNNNPIDRRGHGTHVAGTIGASVNNGLGISGINWDVGLMAIKALSDSGSGTTGNIAKGIRYAADNGAKVINMSLRGEFPCSESQTYQDVIFYANARGVIVVVAAGNDNDDASGYSPASCQGVITVSATGPTNERASYSNYGSIVDLAAPGGDSLKCTDNISCLINSTYPDNQYRLFQGTSMATPHVAGLIGLMLAIKPSLTPEEAELILKESGDSLVTDQPIGKFVDANEALIYLNSTGFVFFPGWNRVGLPQRLVEGFSGRSVLEELGRVCGNVNFEAIGAVENEKWKEYVSQFGGEDFGLNGNMDYWLKADGYCLYGQ